MSDPQTSLVITCSNGQSKPISYELRTGDLLCWAKSKNSASGRGPPRFDGRRDYDITEIDITESDVAEFDITENDITESDITETNIT